MTFEKVYGIDHYLTIYALNHLGLFFYAAKFYDKAAKYLMKCIYLLSLVGGEAVKFYIF
jgi:hypothetical protein